MMLHKYKMNEELNEVRGDFIKQSLPQSFNIRNIEINGDYISFNSEESLDPNLINKKIDRLVYISRSIRKDLLYSYKSERKYKDDPQISLTEKGEMQKVGEGMFLFQGDFLKIFKAIDRYVFAQSEKLKAVEQEYPALWPVELFKSIDYFKEFPQHAILCTTVKDDYSSKKKFTVSYGADKDYKDIQLDSEIMTNPTYGLESAVCDCCYFALKDVENLGNNFYTCCNKVFRNELIEKSGLERLINYTVRDIMAVGDQDFVLYARQCFIDVALELVKDIGLDCVIESANDPFFSNDAVLKNVFQYASKLKYEILAYLPHSKERIAVGSINHHLDFFGKAFNIKHKTGNIAHSACIGIGFERIVYALFCQYGHDLSMWPDNVLKKLKIR